MPVTDLTGTTWILNDAITFSASLGLSNVISFNFTSNNTSFYGFYFDFNSDGDNSLGYRTNQEYSYVEIYNSSGNIVAGKEVYKTVTITGGTDVTNSALISWFESNATQQTVSTKVSVDLTTLPGWSSLSTGSHSITIVAKADGYKNSEPSAGVTVTKEAEDALAETWVINVRPNIGLLYNWNITFTSNNTIFNSMAIKVVDPSPIPGSGGILLTYGDDTYVYYRHTKTGEDIWLDQAYRTVTFETAPTGSLLTWLRANATKQS